MVAHARFVAPTALSAGACGRHRRHTARPNEAMGVLDLANPETRAHDGLAAALACR